MGNSCSFWFLIAVFFVAASFEPGAHAQGYSPPAELLNSPALLVDYGSWLKQQNAFTAPDSETLAYHDLVDIAYDNEVGRDWGPSDYFPEAERRLEAFRARVCSKLTGDRPRLCTVPQKMAVPKDIMDLESALSDPQLNSFLEARWGLWMENVHLPNSHQAFDLEVAPKDGSRRVHAATCFWNFTPQVVHWISIDPVLSDADTYMAGFNLDSDDFPAQFALTDKGVLLNDWQIRLRAMQFAGQWKLAVAIAAEEPPLNPAVDSSNFQFQALYRENQNLFQTVYQKLLVKVQGHQDVVTRFLSERGQGDYPEEVYEHVAYRLLHQIVEIQTAYYALAATQRTHTSERQKSLESLLTLQRYIPNMRIFLLELENRSAPLVSHAAVLDEAVDYGTAMAFSYEQLRVVLGLDNYAGTSYFQKFGYALLDDELFDAGYLKANAPSIYQEMLQPDGKLKRIEDFSPQDQMRLLKKYLVGANGQPSLSGIVRMNGVFRARVHEADLRTLADIIHQAHAGNFQ